MTDKTTNPPTAAELENDAQNENLPLPDTTTIFQNMQHAIVEALHVLGPFSHYHDQSVRMKDLYTYVKDAKIQIGDNIEAGPHRFSIFNSALSGRRSASELFIRIDDPGRQGAWWKLAKSYEDSLTFALEQKGIKKHQQRIRTKGTEVAETPEIAHVKPQPIFKWNKNEVLDILNQLKELAVKTSAYKEENKKLEEKLALEREELYIITSSLKEQDPANYRLLQLEEYSKADEYRKELRNQIEQMQKNLFTISDQSIELQK